MNNEERIKKQLILRQTKYAKSETNFYWLWWTPIGLILSIFNPKVVDKKDLKYKISYFQNLTNITFDESNRYYINVPYRITIPETFINSGIVTLQYRFYDGIDEEFSTINLDFTQKESEKLFDRIFHTKIWGFKTKKCADEDYDKMTTLDECQTFTYQSFNIETFDVLIFVITVILGVIVEKMIFRKK
jgi:hypothetical protein